MTHPQDVSAALWIGGIALAFSLLSFVTVIGFSLDRGYTDARAISLCVAATARANGYPGDTNSTQAWSLFYSSCS